MARITATEMVGVTFTTEEARRLLDAVEQGKLGPPEAPENVALRHKLLVMLQVATATEKRRAALKPQGA
jgi:hypothetical protein